MMGVRKGVPGGSGIEWVESWVSWDLCGLVGRGCLGGWLSVEAGIGGRVEAQGRACVDVRA